MKNHKFWSEIGSGFGEPCASPPPHPTSPPEKLLLSLPFAPYHTPPRRLGTSPSEYAPAVKLSCVSLQKSNMAAWRILRFSANYSRISSIHRSQPVICREMCSRQVYKCLSIAFIRLPSTDVNCCSRGILTRS